MELLDRYLISVKQEINSDNQDDIIREIKANILDELDAREQSGEAKEDALENILKHYGHPCETAQRYAPQAPLVSSEDMPFYKTVLYHGAALVFVVALLKTLSSMLQSNSINPLRLVFQTFGNFIENAALMLLIVTLFFYYFAKTTSLSKWRYKNWTPAKLATFPLAKIKLSDTLNDLTVASFLLLLLWTPLWMSVDAQQGLLFALAPEQEHVRYVLTILCILSVVFALYRISQSNWQRWSLGLYVLDHLLFGLAFLWMASADPLFIEASPEVSKNWPMVSAFVEANLQYCLAITGVVILLIGASQLRKFKLLANTH